MGGLMKLVFLLTLFFTTAFLHAQNLPPPVANQNIEQRLATTWSIQEQDVCVTYPAKDTAWNLTPSITENNFWYLDQRGTCMDQKGNSCTWNYVDGYLQVVFASRNRIYVARPSGDFMSVSGVIHHTDDTRKQGCFQASNLEPRPWTERSPGTINRPADPISIPNGQQLPPPIYNPHPPTFSSPN